MKFVKTPHTRRRALPRRRRTADLVEGAQGQGRRDVASGPGVTP